MIFPDCVALTYIVGLHIAISVLYCIPVVTHSQPSQVKHERAKCLHKDTNVCDAGPLIKQHWFNMACLFGSPPPSFDRWIKTSWIKCLLLKYVNTNTILTIAITLTNLFVWSYN